MKFNDSGEILTSLIVFGKSLAKVDYIHEFLKTIENDNNKWYDIYSVFLGLLFVSYETWKESNFYNEKLNTFINTNENFLLTLRRFRNSIFHFEPDLLSKRQTNFISDTNNVLIADELFQILKNSFYFFSVFKELNRNEVILIRNLLYECIGWMPNDTIEIKQAELDELNQYAFKILDNHIFETKENLSLFINALEAKVLLNKNV